MIHPRKLPALARTVRGTLALLICVTLLPVLAIQAAVYFSWYRSRIAQAESENLDAARAAASTFASFVADVRRQETALAAGLTSLQPYDISRANEFIRKSKGDYESVRSFHWAMPDGVVIASSDPGALGMKVDDRDYFREIVSGKPWVVSDLHRGKPSDEPTIIIATGTRADAGGLQGIVVAAIEPAGLGELFVQMERPYEGTILLFDRRGRLVCRKPEARVTDLNLYSDDSLLRAALEGKEAAGTTISPVTGLRQISARVPVADIGWVAGAGGSEAAIAAPIRASFLSHMGILLAVAAASIGLALLVSRTMVAPLRRLGQHAEAVGRGDLSHRAEPGGVAELDDLAAAFNTMAAGLEEKRSAQEKATAALEREVAERTRAELELRRVSERLRFHVENTPLALIEWDPDYRITRWTDEATRVFGWTAEEMLGKRIDETGLVYAEDVSKVDEVMSDMSAGRRPQNVNANRNYRKDGSVIHCEWYNSALLDAEGKLVSVLSLVLDVTARKRAEEEVERVAKFPAENPSPILRIKRDGTLLYGNAASGSLVEAWGCGVGQRVPEDWLRRVEQSLETGRRMDVETEHEGRVFSFAVVPVVGADYANLYALDVTERKRAEEALREKTGELEASNRELEAFVYSVSHDLRAPLRSIMGFSNALAEDFPNEIDEKAKDWLFRIRGASQRMEVLIADLLELSRITRAPMTRQRVNLSVMARDVAADLAVAKPRRQVEFIIQDGVTADGDQRLLRTVMENLLGNAWKFTSKHPRARIEFGAVRKEDKAVYFVRDDGAGFDMAYAAKLFAPFQRLHASAEFEGTGVGLAAVRRVISRHGGTIWAEGEPEKGATFYFTLD